MTEASSQLDPASIREQLARCMSLDADRLRRRLRGLDRSSRDDAQRANAMTKIVADLQVAVDRMERRRRLRPTVTYPDDLPIALKRDDIASALAKHQVIVVCGETGSGKTTQLPKICLDAGRGLFGVIGHTQPRRIAARTLADRIASELKSEVGGAVGCKIRFHDRTSPEACIKVMTDGILLAETRGDRDLLQYDTLVIDEAHERSLNIDFLLGYVRQLLPRRPDLKVIVTSATIDPERFSEHFGGAPIIEVSGRTYPVETRYRPLATDDPDEEDRDFQEAIADAVRELAREGPGDVLVFLAGEREIRETAKTLAGVHVPGPQPVDVRPLYARQSAGEQARVFARHPGRRIVLATNVAETSLTVPGVRYVIDPGWARISRYSPRSRVQRLPIEKISQASANQRSGRCGRVAQGVCIRLYSEEDFADREAFTPPEILRTSLAQVILQMASLNLGRVEAFPFLEAPVGSMIREGYQTLHELGAVTDDNRLTPIGRSIAKLPVDPRIARMVLAGRDENALKEVLVITAALAVQDPRDRPLEQQTQADQAHAAFRNDQSDFLALLALWEAYQEQARHLSNNKLRKWCKAQFISFMRMRDWQDTHRQLKELVRQEGMKLNDDPADESRIHRALLAGLLTHIGRYDERYEYEGVRGRKFHVFPGSGLFKNKPRWLMAAELVETTRLYARTVARIDPAWIEPLAGHLVKHSYRDPEWEADRQHVAAWEQVSLMGLTIVPRRRINYARVNPVESRRLFIHHALVEGELRTRGRFLADNQALERRIRSLEARTRRHDLMVNLEARFAFYDQRVPADVCSGPAFEKWRVKAERREPHLLLMREADLIPGGAPADIDQACPETMTIAGTALPLRYRFEPGHDADGVTLEVPLELLNQLPDDRLSWPVPGWLHEAVTALIRSLPRHLRRVAAPAPDYAAECLADMTWGRGSLPRELAAALSRRIDADVPADAFDLAALPPHVRMRVAVLDAKGKTLAAGRDLDELRRRLGVQASRSLTATDDPRWRRSHITRWDFGDLPASIAIKRGPVTLTAYPAIVDKGADVSLTLMDTPAAAARHSRNGVRRLYMLELAGELRHQGQRLPGFDRLATLYAPLGAAGDLRQGLLALAVEMRLLGDQPDIRSREEFELRLNAHWSRLGEACAAVAEVAGDILQRRQQLVLRLESGPHPDAWTPALRDVQGQLASLVASGFLMRTPWPWLRQFPRYLAAIETRLERLRQGAQRDAAMAQQVAPWWSRYAQRLREHRERGVFDPHLESLRWLIEELRVSVFAGELGTAVKVSPAVLEEQWRRVSA